jgi:FHA domain.
MAILQEQLSQHLLYLGSLHLFGRNPSQVDTLLNNADASQIHASIRWSGVVWEIVDHSRNGTLINGQALLKNSKMALALGQTIRFAVAGQCSWRVVNIDAPCPMLLPVNHDKAPIALSRLHFLPDETLPEASIHLTSNGQWQWEDADGCTLLQDGDKVQVLGETWLFFNKLEVDATIDINACRDLVAPDVQFIFRVSQNEEHTQLVIVVGEQQVNLGERSHHYSLLVLARRRYSDASRDWDPASQGWISVEQCAAMQKIEPKHLNMHLHRARQQIAQAFSVDMFVDCIERRRGELRFGGFRFRIMRGSEQEAYFDPGTRRYESSIC